MCKEIKLKGVIRLKNGKNFVYFGVLMILVFTFLSFILIGCGGLINLSDGEIVPKIQKALTGYYNTISDVSVRKPFEGVLNTISQVSINYNNVSRTSDSLIFLGMDEINSIEQGLKSSTQTFLTRINNPDFDYYFQEDSSYDFRTVLFNSSLDKWLIIITYKHDGEIRIHLYEVDENIEKSTIIFYRVEINDLIDLTQVVEDGVNDRKVVKCERLYNYSKPESNQVYIDLSSICRLSDDIHKTTFSIKYISNSSNNEEYHYGISNDVDLLVDDLVFETPQSSITLESTETGYLGFEEVLPLFDEYYTFDDLKNIYLDIDKTNHTYMTLVLGDTTISFNLNDESLEGGF